MLAYDEPNYLDEYVVGIQSPTQLVSSLALMLRERNYICLYDTSVLSSPELHIKKSPLEELNRDFLYKWFLFFTGLFHNIKSYPNLVILPEVAEEMNNLIAATLSCIEKKKNQYKAFAPQQKEQWQDIYEQILKNENILTAMHQKLEEYRHQHQPVHSPVFESFLEIIKLLNDTLDLKKLDSRGGNDTDERVACRTFYEVAVNSHNVAVYTRDDDIRKLISATFKFLISKEIQNQLDLPFLKNIPHRNLLVLKYNYEKRVFSRFFESSTLPYVGEFRFPSKLSKNKVTQVWDMAKEILERIQGELNKLQQQEATVPEEHQTVELNLSEEVVHKAAEKIFVNIADWKIAEQDSGGFSRKIEILEHLSIITSYLGHIELQDQIMQQQQKYQKICLENIITQLKQSQQGLQKKFEILSSPPLPNRDWQQIQATAEAIHEQLSQLSFFESALRANFHKANHDDYLHFKQLLKKFLDSGFTLNEKETPIPHEKISEITGLPLQDTIKIMETQHIRHHPTHAYLTQYYLVFFMSLR